MIKPLNTGLSVLATVSFYKLNGLNFSPANNKSTGFLPVKECCRRHQQMRFLKGRHHFLMQDRIYFYLKKIQGKNGYA
jgi:hypothetical protein